MKKRLCALLLALTVILSLTPALAAKTVFTDISPDGTAGGPWYDYESIQVCVDAGILQGSGGEFRPAGTLTVGETAVIAARFYVQTTGTTLREPAEGEAWYAPAMAVMEKTGGVNYADPLSSVTRESFICAVATGIPLFNMPELNQITVLPDTDNPIVPMFYRAGLLTGTDKNGTFAGDKTLTRAEAAVILARIVEPERRVRFTPALSEDERLSLLLAKSLTENPKTLIIYDDISDSFGGKLSPALTDEELERALTLAGVAADEVMLRIGGVTIAAEQYLPLLMFEIKQSPDIEGLPFIASPYPILMDDISYSAPDAVKLLTAYECVDSILLLLGGYAQLTTVDYIAYLKEHPLSETEALKSLDIQQFYEAFMDGLEK